MPTRRGWALLGAALGLYVGGRIVGLVQLVVLGVQAGLLLGGAAVWTRTRAARISVERDAPERLRVGGDGRVEMSVTNTGTRRSPTLTISETFDGGRRSARFAVPPLDPGQSAAVAYRMPTERRGRVVLGPATASVDDPFGLTVASWRAGESDAVIVHPRIHDVLPPPDAGGDELDREAAHVRGRPEASGEFLTLREYAVGDDLRRVHWRSTARRDTLMIRQEESRRRAPAVILLDVRAGSHDCASFEVAIEAAASIATSLEGTGRPFQVVTTAARRLDVPGRRGLGALLDALAELEVGGPDQLTAAALPTPTVPVLVAILGRPRERDLHALDLLVTTHGTLTVVATHPGATVLPPGTTPTLWCGVTDEQPFPDAWNSAVIRWQHDTARRFLPSRSPR